MRLLEALEPSGFFVKVRTEHAEDAAGTFIPHVIYFAVWHMMLADVCPHISIRPEGYRRGNGALGIKRVTAGLEPLLGAQFALMGQRTNDGHAPAFLGILFQRLFLHFAAAACANFERRVHQIMPLAGDMVTGGFTVAA